MLSNSHTHSHSGEQALTSAKVERVKQQATRLFSAGEEEYELISTQSMQHDQRGSEDRRVQPRAAADALQVPARAQRYLLRAVPHSTRSIFAGIRVAQHAVPACAFAKKARGHYSEHCLLARTSSLSSSILRLEATSHKQQQTTHTNSMSFFQRLVSYVVNDVAVKALANNRAFQRFALRTHYRVEDAKSIANEGATSLQSQIEQAAPKVKEFAAALKDELARDLKKMK